MAWLVWLAILVVIVIVYRGKTNTTAAPAGSHDGPIEAVTFYWRPG